MSGNITADQVRTLTENINRYLRNAATDAGFAYAENDIPGLVAEFAPGWGYVEVTAVGDESPSVELTGYRPPD